MDTRYGWKERKKRKDRVLLDEKHKGQHFAKLNVAIMGLYGYLRVRTYRA
jgi:hypothetical protein